MNNENYIAMGTTPTVSITIKNKNGEPLDFSLTDQSSFRVYFKQNNGRTVIYKSGSFVILDPENSKVTTYLTQKDTLAFTPGDVDIEVRWLFNSYLPNNDKKAGKTEIKSVPIGKVLKREVITDGSE